MRAIALLSGAILSVAVLAACNGGATEPPFLLETSPTPTAETSVTPDLTPTAAPGTPTPPESGGTDGFRAFAALVVSALADGDASFISARAVEDELTCVGDEQLGPCLGLLPGTVLRGIPSATAQSDPSTLLTTDQYAATLLDWSSRAKPDVSDGYGSGALVLHALTHQPASANREEAYQAVVTGIFTISDSNFRQARILSFQLLDGNWRLTRELFDTVPGTVADWLSGDCDKCYDHWERWEGTP